MKKTLLIFLLSFIGLAAAFAQDPQIKKLEKILAEHTQQDTFRVNRLNELGRMAGYPIAKLNGLADEVLTLSRKLNYPEGEVYGLMKKAGAIYYVKQDTTASYAVMKQAVDLATKLDDKRHLVRVYSTFAQAENGAGNNKQALAYYLRAMAAAEATRDKTVISAAQIRMAGFYQNSGGDYIKAMDWSLKAERSAEEANDLPSMATAWSNLAGVYTVIGDRANALSYYQKALDANKKLGNKNLEFNLLNRIGEMNRLNGNYPAAIQAYIEGVQKSYTTYNTELSESNLADVYVRMGNLPLAFKYAFKSLDSAKSIKDTEGEEWIDGILGRAYLKLNKPDSALYYAKIGYAKAVGSSTLEYKRDNAEVLTNAYAMLKDYANAYKYHVEYISYRDSMLSAEVSNRTALLQYNYALAKKQAQITTLNQDKKAQQYFLSGAFIVILLIVVTVIILLRNNRQKQKANLLLQKQKHIIEEQRDATNKALADLQLTQRQLIQSEKMASLGELTAGIAHEIQNPLNFINNFSEVNLELIGELREERRNPVADPALQDELLTDIEANLAKVRHHGQRADSIVKGMLQHSRKTSDTKEVTNINKLAEEYLRLAYHGLRAKDKSFNAELVTSFDPKLSEANIVPQDVGRGLINLFNNAFYAVAQKAKTAGPDYKPTVAISTAAKDGKVVITIKDNGNGIPQSIKEKIMQPFFTTKPTGEGTGLGLSLTYDMVVKGHGGEFYVDSKEGEGSEFVIKLPMG